MGLGLISLQNNVNECAYYAVLSEGAIEHRQLP